MRKLEFFSTGDYNKALNFGSPTPRIAKKRDAVYNKVMENVDLIRETAKQLGLFSASVDMQGSQLGVALKEASMKAYLESYAGYIAIERPLTQMKELIVYKDMVTKGTGRVVMPMIGKQDPRGTAEAKTTSTIPVGTPVGTIELGSAVVPGSVMIVAILNGDGATIIDDRKGTLLAAGGVLKTGTIDYNTGKIEYETGVAPIAGDEFKITYSKDMLPSNTPERIKPVQHYFEITAKVNKFEYEFDLITAAINTKSLGSDLAADMQDAVKDEHLMSINNQLVKALKEGYAGTTLTIDLSSFSVAAGRFDSLLRTFASGLTSVDTALGKKTYKAVVATAYVVGDGLGDVFASMTDSDYWVPNNTGFINGLIGFYKGRAVLRHLSLDRFEGFAVHKTADGELAPTALGIFLPATDLPLVGNFNNTNEIAGGIYAVEGADLLTSDLAMRFEILMPADWMGNN